jgi:hypothetical protein
MRFLKYISKKDNIPDGTFFINVDNINHIYYDGVKELTIRY